MQKKVYMSMDWTGTKVKTAAKSAKAMKNNAIHRFLKPSPKVSA